MISLEDSFGPSAKHSDYAVNDRIRYRCEGQVCTGTIVHAVAPSHEEGWPLHYIVERDTRGGWPDTVRVHEIIELLDSQAG